MARLLTVKNRILLGLALVGDALDEVRLLGGLVPATYKNVYGWVPPQYRRNNLYKAVASLLKTKDIERRIEKGEVCFVLTSQGNEKVKRVFPLVKLAKVKWDGMFTQVVFDIKEVDRKVRNAFRRKLLSLGFGRLQRSVYIIPHNIAWEIAEVVENYRLQNVVKIFRSQLVMGDPKKLAEKVWKISALNKKYKKLLEEWEKGRELRGEKRVNFVRALKEKLLDIVVKDPFLPQELLPKDWAGEEARRKISLL